MAVKKQVVTPERFSTGYTWEAYVETMKSNKERHLQNYAEFQLSDDDKEFFRKAVEKAGGALKVVLLTEDWCPDCYRNAPIIAKIAASVPGIELRVFPRDQNLDIMDRYLNKGEFRSIPTAVWADADLGELAVWIERPAEANEDLARLAAELESVPQEERRRIQAARSQELYQTKWRYLVVQETRERLAQALGL